MSRRARMRLVARDLKHADAYMAPDPADEEDDDDGNAPDWQENYSCPYCSKAKPKPFHCTACNYTAEAA